MGGASAIDAAGDQLVGGRPMSVTLQHLYEWALSEQTRLDAWERTGQLDPGKRHALDCAAGCVRLIDAVLSDQVILDRLKAAAARRATAAREARTKTAEATAS